MFRVRVCVDVWWVVVVWAERTGAGTGLVDSLHNDLCCFWSSHASFSVTHSGRRQALTRCFESGTLHYITCASVSFSLRVW